MTVLLPLLVIALFAAAFVVAVSFRLRQERGRRAGWAAEAQRLGLRHAKGDPLGLAERLKVDAVEETVHGELGGRRVAAVNVARVQDHGHQPGSGPPARFVWSVGVALDAAGAPTATVDRRPQRVALTHAPLPASELEGLLRETAARAS